jgi:predicted nicotinamide N-methyase
VRPNPEEFIRDRLLLAPLSFRPDISLYRPTPQSGLAAWLAQMGREDDPPYWAYAWAGGAALTLYLRDHPETVVGKTVVDFGAGSGLVGIAAHLAGASRVHAIEPDPLACAAITLNAVANGAAIDIWSGPDLPQVDIILAGDVYYDSDVAAKTTAILRTSAASVIVGDPFRRDLPLDALDQRAEYQVPDVGGGLTRAGVFALRPGHNGNAP